jgi:hypothetical protein
MASRYLTFEGQFEDGVLGTFRLIRGFANLKELAEISVPYELVETPEGLVGGHQRALDDEHAEGIRRYLEGGDRRFLPEVILSVRTPLESELSDDLRPIGVTSTTDNGIEIRRAWKSPNMRVHRVRVDRNRLADIHAVKAIRRVDGNHRLALAQQLEDDPGLASKYLASFCMVLLGPADEEADNYAESLIFHTINSTALPLESEHALRLILGQGRDYDMPPDQEFAYSPELHLTRLLRDGLLALSEPAQGRIGEKPLTSLSRAAQGLLELNPDVAADRETLTSYARALIAALDDIVTRLEPTQPALCAADYFIELAARAWEATPSGAAHASRVNEVVEYLGLLANWLGTDGLVNLNASDPLSKQLIEIYSAVRARVPRRVFLARWYPRASDGEHLEKAKLRLDQIKAALRQLEEEDGQRLELIDMGSQAGSTFPIQDEMYEAIASSDIILIDLSGVRPNVCIEAGYALRHHEKGRLIFMFQPTTEHAQVPFDLAPFRYEPFTDTAQIPGKLLPHLREIVQRAAVGS